MIKGIISNYAFMLLIKRCMPCIPISISTQLTVVTLPSDTSYFSESGKAPSPCTVTWRPSYGKVMESYFALARSHIVHWWGDTHTHTHTKPRDLLAHFFPAWLYCTMHILYSRLAAPPSTRQGSAEHKLHVPHTKLGISVFFLLIFSILKNYFFHFLSS